MVAVAPYFFSTIAAVLQAPNLSRIIEGAISEALALKPRPTSNSTFASITGPVIRRNFPDPSAIKVGDMWHAFATNNNNDGQVQAAVSRDFENWTYLNKSTLPDAGPWSTGKAVWAPDVVQLSNGNFVLYYSAAVASSSAQHCVGAATSSTIEGPYKPSESAFACPLQIGGAIDADGFFDPFTRKRYVLYKVDGNSLGHGGACMNGVEPLVPTPIYLQEVEEDGVTTIGEPVTILDRTDEDGPLVEAPSLHVSEEGIYFLFFSSDCYTTPRYDVKYATATNISGPYTRADEALLATSDGPNLVAPGGADVASGPGGYMVFHADIGSSDGRLREMYTARPKFKGTKVTL